MRWVKNLSQDERFGRAPLFKLQSEGGLNPPSLCNLNKTGFQSGSAFA